MAPICFTPPDLGDLRYYAHLQYKRFKVLDYLKAGLNKNTFIIAHTCVILASFTSSRHCLIIRVIWKNCIRHIFSPQNEGKSAAL